MASCMGLLHVYSRLHSFFESPLLQCVHGVSNICVLINLKSGLLQYALLFVVTFYYEICKFIIFGSSSGCLAASLMSAFSNQPLHLSNPCSSRYKSR